MPPSPKALDALALEYMLARNLLAGQQDRVDQLRDRLLELVERHGHVPARSTKTRALIGEQFEIRVSRPVEVTVDTQTAEHIKWACAAADVGRLFRRLFRRVETYVLVNGAEKLINGDRLPPRAPRNLRSLFARALRVRELAPQLEVRKRDTKSEAA